LTGNKISHGGNTVKKAVLILVSAIVLAFIVITGCSKASLPNGPAATNTPAAAVATATATATLTSTELPTDTATPNLIAYVTLRKLTYVNNDRTPVPSNFYSIEISDHGTPVANATVVVNATPVTYEGVVSTYGRYRMFNVDAVTGASYTTNIYYKGLTLTAGMVMPGGQVLNANADSVSWTDGGSSRGIDIFNSSDVETYGAAMPASPHPIPVATAYPASDTYSIACVITRNGTFSGTALPYFNSGIADYDEYFQYTIIK
jgi:hypothetical protein